MVIFRRQLRIGGTIPAWLLLVFSSGFALGPVASLAGDWHVGLSAVGGKSPVKGENEGAGLIPVLAYRGERFHANLGNPGVSFFDGPTDFGGLGYSLFKGETINVDLIGQFRLIEIEPDDHAELRGLRTRKAGFDAGFKASWKTELGELNAKLLTDVSGRSRGQEVILGYAYPIQKGNWVLRPEIGVSWQSRKLVDYYYGVEASEATIHRGVYQGKSTFVPFAGIQAEYAFSEQTRLVGGAGVSRLGDGISDSPIVDEETIPGGYLGLVYQF